MDCEIFIPVTQNLTQLRACLETLLAHRDTATAAIYLCVAPQNDSNAIDDFTRSYLHSLLKQHAHLHWHDLPETLSGLALCQHALSMCQSNYLVYLSPEVLVPDECLSRSLKIMQQANRVAQVVPVNGSATAALPLSAGANPYGMDALLQAQAREHSIELPAHLAACSLFRRSALQGLEASAFDGEPCFAQRLQSRGYQCILADDVYVYHPAHATLAASEVALNALPEDLRKIPQRWDPMPVIWQTYRAMLKAWQAKQLWTLSLAAVQGSWRLLGSHRDKPSAQQLAQVIRPQRLRVTYVLHELVVAGGVLSVIQLVNGLVRQGVEARIVALFEDPDLQQTWPILSRPIIFKRPEELIRDCPETDVLVATHWVTAAWTKAIADSGRCKASAYFLQDYEAWFYPESEQATRQKVIDTYAWFEHKIVKSDWLRDLVKKDGYDCHKIRLGMNLDRFYPRDVPKTESQAPCILAMARPRTPRRGFTHVIEALKQIKQARPEVQILLFGDNRLSSHDIPFDYENCGVVSDQDTLAELYTRADVFIDGSDYQGFGRLALEAMACGTACVATGVGGVTEYVRHEENCLVVEPKQPKQFAAAMLRLLDDAQLCEQLRQGGFDTVALYDVKREIKETHDYFAGLCSTFLDRHT